jgi:hypothetical protein
MRNNKEKEKKKEIRSQCCPLRKFVNTAIHDDEDDEEEYESEDVEGEVCQEER